MSQSGGSVVAGRILMVAGVLSAVGGALFLAGMVPVARFTGLLVGGVLVVAGLVDIVLGQRLVRREER